MIKNEIRSLTGIRGIAAVYVMFYHWEYFIMSNVSTGVFASILKTALSHGNWCVDLFFALSGFLLALTSNSNSIALNRYSYYDFMCKRFCRVYPIYFVLTALYFILQILFAKVKPDFLEGIVNLTLFQDITSVSSIIPTAWSLSVEWIIYFLFPFFTIFTFANIQTIYRVLILIFIPATILIILGHPKIIFVDERWHLTTFKLETFVSALIQGPQAVLRGMCSYFLGMAAYLLYERDFHKKISEKLFVTVTLIQIGCLFSDYKLANIIFIMLLPLSLLYLVRNKSIANRLFSTKLMYFIGEISFSLYLIHWLFVMSISPRIENFLLRNNVSFYKLYTFCIVFISVIVISTLLYKYLEKPLNIKLRAKLLLKRRI